MNREELKKYKYREEWIKDRIEYIEGYKETINKLVATISDMPNGSREVQDGMAEKIAKLVDYSREVLEDIDKQKEKQKAILEQIEKIEYPYSNILFKVYVLGKTLIKVADEMGYSYIHICREHGNALSKFDEYDMK